MVSETSSRIDELPQAACPGDEAVISLTINPEYVAKSFFPHELMRDVGIEVIGSRPKRQFLKSVPGAENPVKSLPLSYSRGATGRHQELESAVAGLALRQRQRKRAHID